MRGERGQSDNMRRTVRKHVENMGRMERKLQESPRRMPREHPVNGEMHLENGVIDSFFL